MAKSSKKKAGDDDELFPDTGAKPKTKKVEKPESRKSETKKVDKKTETRKVEKRDLDKREQEKAEPLSHVKGSSPLEHLRDPAPAKADKPEKSLPAAEVTKAISASPPRHVKLIVAAVALVAIGGAALLLGPALVNSNDDPSRVKGNRTAAAGTAPTPQQPATPTLRPTNDMRPVEPEQPNPLTPGSTKLQPQPLKPIAAKASQREGKSAKELATKSANHGAVARVLDLFDAVRKVDFNENRLFEDYQAKQARENELLEQIRGLGLTGIDAVKDMILNVNDPGYQIFLAKALGGMKDPEALKAAAEILATCHDIAVQTTLVRFLPDTADATAVIAQAFGDEQNPNVRSMLLREFSRRVNETPDPSDPNAQLGNSDMARNMFRKAAMDDPDPNVRAEAVSIIGHRGDARDMDLMAQIAKTEQNLQIRQSAIVSYAMTGQETALPFLTDLATHDDTLEVRASAVLAIARVGNDSAISILDQIAQTDPRDEIKSRAAGFAASLRQRQQNDQKERRGIDAQPVPIDPARRRNGG